MRPEKIKRILKHSEYNKKTILENEYDKQYKKFIQNKRVVFVGPSPCLIGKGEGDLIDSYDVVIRTNGGWPVHPDRAIDYGTRTDVYCVNVQYSREMFPLPFETYRDSGIHFLIFKAVDDKIRDEARKYIKARDIMCIVKDVMQSVHSPLFGCAILLDVLRCDPLELYITGMDFYKNAPKRFGGRGDYGKFYFDGYLPDTIMDKADEINAGRDYAHDKYSNTSFIFNLYRKYPITMKQETFESMKHILMDEIEKYEHQNHCRNWHKSQRFN